MQSGLLRNKSSYTNPFRIAPSFRKDRFVTTVMTESELLPLRCPCRDLAVIDRHAVTIPVLTDPLILPDLPRLPSRHLLIDALWLSERIEQLVRGHPLPYLLVHDHVRYIG